MYTVAAPGLLLFVIIIAAVVLLASVFWIWMLIDCALYERSGISKIVWVLVIFFTHFLGAAIYFFRAVFPNWPDEYCVKILRNQIPALNQSSRIIIYDSPMPEPGTLPATLEKQKR